MVPIDQDGIGCPAKRWVQGLETLIEVDLDHFFAWVFDQSVDKVGIPLGHGHMVRISSGWHFFARQNEF
jgi:hypothetical protein